MSFETTLQMMDHDARWPAIYVGDDCHLAKLWFEDHGVPYTAADLLRFAELMRAERRRTE